MDPKQRIGVAVVLVVALGAIIVVSTTGDTPGDGPETTPIAGPTTITGASTPAAPETTTGAEDGDRVGSSSEISSDTTQNEAGPPATNPTGTGGSADGATTTRPPRPLTLEEFFGTPSGPDVVEHSRLQAVERATARCMDQRGFSYRPREITVQPEDGPGIDVVRRIGFGISTSWSSDGETPPSGSTAPTTTAPRRPQYYIALEGGYLGDGHRADEVGCRSHAVSTQNERFRPARDAWSSLEGELAALEAEIEADQRVRGAIEEWSACMGQQGFPYERPNQVFTEGVTEIQTRLDELTGGRTVNTNPFAGWSEEEIEAFYRENSEEAVRRYIDEVTSITVPQVDGDALEEIQDFEISLATANAECGRIIERAEDSIRREYEGAFIAEHRQALRDIRTQVRDLVSG